MNKGVGRVLSSVVNHSVEDAGKGKTFQTLLLGDVDF
jgi:hypothetical protein